MIRVTVKSLAAKLQVEYPTASALIKLMESKGQAKEVGKRPNLTGKGKPSVIYEIPESFEISFAGSAVDETVAA
jgi:Mn-dependent DtxR family transcriptional regulator